MQQWWRDGPDIYAAVQSVAWPKTWDPTVNSSLRIVINARADEKLTLGDIQTGKAGGVYRWYAESRAAFAHDSFFQGGMNGTLYFSFAESTHVELPVFPYWELTIFTSLGCNALACSNYGELGCCLLRFWRCFKFSSSCGAKKAFFWTFSGL